MASTSSLLSGSLLPGVIAIERVLSMGQIELSGIQSGCKQMTNVKLNSEKENYFII